MKIIMGSPTKIEVNIIIVVILILVHIIVTSSIVIVRYSWLLVVLNRLWFWGNWGWRLGGGRSLGRFGVLIARRRISDGFNNEAASKVAPKVLQIGEEILFEVLWLCHV